jgi:hypothetical protein
MFLVTVVTQHGSLVSANANESHLLHIPKQDDSLRHLFHINFLTATKVTLQSSYGTFVSARKHYQCVLTTDINPKYWETFELEYTEVCNKVAFRTAHGTYLSADKNGIITQTDASDETETDIFELCFFPVSIRTHHDTYIGTRLQQTSIEGSAIFIPEFHEGKIALRTSNGSYVSARDDGSITMVQHCQNWERFLVRYKKPLVYFVTHFETFLSAERRGGIVQVDFVHTNEYFELIPAEPDKGMLMVGLDSHGDEF